MVLRSGIIIPFQFRDTKKLLMIGVPEENRDLSIWDLKNVVRAAFGIYNFEFRNKKIGFNIPDELLLHYLAQRHDLTNFVIEIGQANDDTNFKETLSFEASCSQKLHVPLPQRSNESTNSTQTPNYAPPIQMQQQRLDKSPLELVANNSEHSLSNQEPPQKIRVTQVYTGQTTPESLTQSIDPMDIIPKSEQEEAEMDAREARYQAREQAIQQQQQALQQQQQQHQQASQQHHQPQQLHPAQAQQTPIQLPPHFFPNYAHLPPMHGNLTPVPPQQPQQQQQQYSPAMMNRFRRRGERMSKDQKELYVKYFEENPCMLTQRRNDIMLEPHWNKLANMLNSVPQGAVKNVEEWKQTFDAWRYRVFMYTRYNSKLSGTTAQNPKNFKPLTSTDQRAYAMWTSHKNTAPPDFDKLDMFDNLDETQADYAY